MSGAAPCTALPFPHPNAATPATPAAPAHRSPA